MVRRSDGIERSFDMKLRRVSCARLRRDWTDVTALHEILHQM